MTDESQRWASPRVVTPGIIEAVPTTADNNATTMSPRVVTPGIIEASIP